MSWRFHSRHADSFVDDSPGDIDVGRRHESLELAAGVDLDNRETIPGLDQVDAGEPGADGGAGAQGERLDVRGDRARHRLRTARSIRHPVLGRAVGRGENALTDDIGTDVTVRFLEILLDIKDEI